MHPASNKTSYNIHQKVKIRKKYWYQCCYDENQEGYVYAFLPLIDLNVQSLHYIVPNEDLLVGDVD